MPRIKESQRFSSQTITQNGTVISTYPVQGHYVREERADVIKNSPSPGMPPAWRKPLPYYIQVVHQEGPYGTWDVDSYGYAMRFEGSLYDRTELVSFNGPGYEPPSYPSWHENHALIKCLGKLKDGQLNLPVVLGERQSTVDLVTDNVGRLYRGYKSARKGRFREAFGHLRHTPRNKGWDKEMSSRILEFNYGVKPLVEDMTNAVNLLHQRESMFGVNGLIKATGSIGRDENGDMIMVKECYRGAELTGAPFTRLIEHGVSTTVKLYFTPDCELAQSAKMLGLTNPAEVVWELVPLSFVVDMVLPFGAFLSSLNADAGLKFQAGCVTQMSVCVTRYAPYSSPDPSRGSTMLTSGVRRVMKMNRRVYADLPVPLPPIVPSRKLNLKKGLNLIALFSAFR